MPQQFNYLLVFSTLQPKINKFSFGDVVCVHVCVCVCVHVCACVCVCVCVMLHVNDCTEGNRKV